MVLYRLGVIFGRCWIRSFIHFQRQALRVLQSYAVKWIVDDLWSQNRACNCIELIHNDTVRQGKQFVTGANIDRT